jgi:hypothetical protein
VIFGGLEHTFTAKTVPPVWGKDGRFDVTAILENREGILPGMQGEASIQ